MPRKPAKMYRAEFQELAGIGRTRYFDLFADPDLIERLGGGIDEFGRYVNRAKALDYIAAHRAEREAKRLKVRENLGRFASRTPPPRGRPCPACGRRITRKPTRCRHCGAEVPAADPPLPAD